MFCSSGLPSHFLGVHWQEAIQFNICYEWLPKFFLILHFLSIKEDAYEKAYQRVRIIREKKMSKSGRRWNVYSLSENLKCCLTGRRNRLDQCLKILLEALPSSGPKACTLKRPKRSKIHWKGRLCDHQDNTSILKILNEEWIYFKWDCGRSKVRDLDLCFTQSQP